MPERLEIIEQSIAQNDAIELVKLHNDLWLSPQDNLDDDMRQEVHFHIAPVEPIYKAKQLEAIRQGIAPELKADFDQSFYGNRIGSMRLGHKQYSELIGIAHITGSSEFKSVSTRLADEFTPKIDLKSPVYRFIMVRLFPDVRIAQDAEPRIFSTQFLRPREIARAKRDYAQFGRIAAWPS